ncbi:protein of unknown function [Trichlorobacter ammonificans]|uniref:Uncharacterized protein n=1 Tax=Trichlorobacter ammonificans TaxID=2916410 RepID=A0ABM9D949_9BACT|nr:protein of unknown function [Trichlorobacter ammonificans]
MPWHPLFISTSSLHPAVSSKGPLASSLKVGTDIPLQAIPAYRGQHTTVEKGPRFIQYSARALQEQKQTGQRAK